MVQATNAIAARYMARVDARTMALIGSGWQASAAIEAMRFVRPIEDVRVYSRSAENRNGFAQRMGARSSTRVVPAEYPLVGDDPYNLPPRNLYRICCPSGLTWSRGRPLGC